MTCLSVNLNKIALIRNSRDTRVPSVTAAAVTAIDAGAQGITVHPRPDQRHIRPADVYDLAELLAAPRYSGIEFNIEGNPFAGPEDNGYPGFMALVTDVCPDQCTLVPDDPGQLTSDHGWDLHTYLQGQAAGQSPLDAVLGQLKAIKARVSLFMDPDTRQISLASQLGADRIELYTGPYAAAMQAVAPDSVATGAAVSGAAATGAAVSGAAASGTAASDSAASGTLAPKQADSQLADAEQILSDFARAAEHALALGLGINAGHDLNQQNLAEFCRRVPAVLEVSIGHAIMVDALWQGLAETIMQYRKILDTL